MVWSRVSAACAVAALFGAANLSASILIYDDFMAAGWSGAQWDMTTTTEVTRDGSAAALSTRTASGGTTKIGVGHAGLMVGENTIFEFWMNSSDGAATNAITVYIDWVGSGNASNAYYQFDTRNYARTYNVDGVDTPIANVRTDADGTTWQQVRVDLTEPIYTGWPYELHQFNPETHALRYLGINSTTSNLVVDDMRLDAVPEPTILGLGAMAGLAALARRRRQN